MKNLKDIVLEKLKVSPNKFEPYLVTSNKVACLLKQYFGWLFGVIPDEISQQDFEDFEILNDNHIKQSFDSYTALFKWFEINKDNEIGVNCASIKNQGEFLQTFSVDDIFFRFYTGDDFKDIVIN